VQVVFTEPKHNKKVKRGLQLGLKMELITTHKAYTCS